MVHSDATITDPDTGDLTQKPTRDRFSGWEKYSEQLANYDPFCYNTVQLQQQLDAQAALLFSEDTEVHITDAAAKDGFKTDTQHLDSPSQVETHMANEFADLRIISIVRKHSLKVLKISRDTMLKILSRHEIGPCFLDLIFSFRKVDELSEKGHSLWTPIESSSNVTEICYQFKYMERNDHLQGDKWSERQIGVYHRFSSADKAVMILLHAGLKTEARQRLEDVFSKGQYSQPRNSSPMLLHALILSSYLDNWRWMLDDRGNECLDKEKRGFTVSLNHQSLNFTELQTLRNLQSKLLRDSAILEATKVTISSLLTATTRLSDKTQGCDVVKRSPQDDENFSVPGDMPEVRALKILELKCEGYLRSIDVLQNRASKLTKLLSDALNLQSQEATIKIADSTFELTQQSVDDNAIVRVITVITLIYLPVQGVATFFGMNLTSLPPSTNRILFAKDWWLFLAVSIPLTILTLAVLGVASLIERRKKKERGRQKLSGVI